MLLTTSLLSRGQLLQSLLSKCRPIFTSNKDNGAVRGGNKTLEEKVGLPPRPKKPLTPYFRFMKQLRPVLSKEHPNLIPTEVIRMVSKRWETADNSVKERLQEEYKRDQQKYVEIRAKYDAKISDEQRLEMKQIKQDAVDAKVRKEMRKRVHELGRPKKPPSAFLSFLIAERTVTPQLSTQTYRDWHHKTVSKWKRLTNEEKQRFIQEARLAMDKYKKDIVVWEDEMIKLGHKDVVRQSNLLEPVTAAAAVATVKATETKTKKPH